MISRIKLLFFDLMLVFVSLFIRRNKRRIVIGSWAGKLYIDNSRYLLEEMLRSLDASYTFYWIGNPELKEELPRDGRLRVLKMNSISSMLLLLRCKYFFCSQFPTIDICLYNVYCGAVITYLHHGFPIKKIGDDKISSQHKKNYIPSRIKNLLFHNQYDYFIVSSEIHGKIFLSAFGTKGCKRESLLKTGTPRNDFLINLSAAEKGSIKNAYRKKFGIADAQKIILYLPTFRRLNANVESLYHRSVSAEEEEIQTLLRKYNFILIEKGHFADHSDGLSDLCSNAQQHYICLGNNVNVQELMVCADILISDYSGAFVDFLIMDRPIIHYIYDYDYYRNMDSGLYFSKEEFACGEAVSNYGELLIELEKCMRGIDSCVNRRRTRRNMFLEYERGEASKIIIERVIKDR